MRNTIYNYIVIVEMSQSTYERFQTSLKFKPATCYFAKTNHSFR